MRGATLVDARDDVLALISTRAPLAGSDTPSSTASRSRFDFNPRSPCGERRRPPWFRRPTVCYFNPRSPCGERRLLGGLVLLDYVFQSALPLRGATSDGSRNTAPHRDFNPRSPCGGDGRRRRDRASRQISIRAPLAGSDCSFVHAMPAPYNFNPRSPCGERRSSPAPSARQRNFNPRSPCGERLDFTLTSVHRCVFQSTLPLRGATVVSPRAGHVLYISIRAPLAGSDTKQQPVHFQQFINFNPRSPCGERLTR